MDRSAIIITSVRHPATQKQHRGKIFDCEVAGSINDITSCSQKSFPLPVHDGHGWMRTAFSVIEHVLVLSNMITTVTDGWTPDSQTKLYTMSDLDATLQERCITENIDL